MGVQKLIVVIEDSPVEIDFDVTSTLSVLRQTLIDQKYISTDGETQSWRFVRAKNDATDTINETSSERYIVVSVFVNDNKVRMTNVQLRKPVNLQLFAGTIPQDIKFDVSRKLCDLRNFLIEKQYISDDNDEYAWRFLSPNAKDLNGDVSEAIIGMDGSEKLIQVNEFLYGSNKIRMVNIIGDKNPDLIGVETDYLFNGDIEVTVYRNDDVTPDKFQPVMLKDVKTANKHLMTNFSNVVVCEKGTALHFRLHSRNHAGMAYSIVPDEGRAICEWITAPSPDCGISWYDGTDDQSIIVDSTKNLDIPTRELIGHRRITVKAWRYISYTRGGKTYIVDGPSKLQVMSDEVGVVPGKSIESGSTKPGDKFNPEHTGTGGGSSNTDPNDILGHVEIDFFVFRTRKDAESMIESRISPIYD